MEVRRLAMIVSHLSVKRKFHSDRCGATLASSSEDCVSRGLVPETRFSASKHNNDGPMASVDNTCLILEGCCAQDAKAKGKGKIAKAGSVENIGKSGVSIQEKVDMKTNALAMERGECSHNKANVAGSCANLSAELRNKGTLHSQLTRSHGMVNETEDSCVFCEIIRGQAPAFKLYEDETCLCILDINPLSHGHSLIIPKTHFSSLEVTPPSVAAAMCAVVPILSNAILEATRCDSFNLLVNSGAAAGQVIFHTHFHIIPRSIHDKLWRSESVRRRPLCLNQETSILAECIRGKLSALQT